MQDARQLSYQEMSLDQSGSIMSRDAKAHLRKLHGYCITCLGVPTLLVEIHRSKMNPLWLSKKKRSVPGETYNGMCLRCNPSLDPQSVTTAACAVAAAPSPSSSTRSLESAPPRRSRSNDEGMGVNAASTHSRGSMRNSNRHSIELFDTQSLSSTSNIRASNNTAETDNRTIASASTSDASVTTAESRNSRPKTAPNSVQSEIYGTQASMLRSAGSANAQPRPFPPAAESTRSLDNADNNRSTGNVARRTPPQRCYSEATGAMASTSVRGADRLSNLQNSNNDRNDDSRQRSSRHQMPPRPESGRSLASKGNLSNRSLSSSQHLSSSVLSHSSGDNNNNRKSYSSIGGESASFERESSLETKPSSVQRTDSKASASITAADTSLPATVETTSLVDSTKSFYKGSRPNRGGTRASSNSNIDGTGMVPPIVQTSALADAAPLLGISTLSLDTTASYPQLTPGVSRSESGTTVVTRLTRASDAHSVDSSGRDGDVQEEPDNKPSTSNTAPPTEHLSPPTLTPGNNGDKFGDSDSASTSNHLKEAGQTESPDCSDTNEAPADGDEAVHDLRAMIQVMKNNEDLGLVTEIIVSYMDAHVANEKVQLYSLEVMAELFEDAVTDSAVLVSKIVRAMETFSSSVDIQISGCKVVGSLASNVNNGTILVRTGVCKLVYRTFQQDQKHHELVSNAFASLRVLSSLSSQARRDLRNLDDASENICQAMRTHPANIDIQRDGCALLSNISVDVEKNAVSSVGEFVLGAVVGAINAHRNDETVVTSACFALKNFMYEHTNLRTARRVGNIFDTLQHASLRGCDDAIVVLEKLQISRAEDESFEEQALQSLRALVEIRAADKQLVEEVLDVMKNFDWSVTIIESGVAILKSLVESSDLHKEALRESEAPARLRHYLDRVPSGTSEDVRLLLELTGREARTCIGEEKVME